MSLEYCKTCILYIYTSHDINTVWIKKHSSLIEVGRLHDYFFMVMFGFRVRYSTTDTKYIFMKASVLRIRLMNEVEVDCQL